MENCFLKRLLSDEILLGGGGFRFNRTLNKLFIGRDRLLSMNKTREQILQEKMIRLKRETERETILENSSMSHHPGYINKLLNLREQ